jgi:hypothetical protein
MKGFIVQAYNGSSYILSNPDDATAKEGWWEIMLPESERRTGWWWLTIFGPKCPAGVATSDPQCQKYARLSERVKVEVVYPAETIINADWICHRDCQNPTDK